MKLKTKILPLFLFLTATLSAASLQIVVRDDKGAITQDVTFGINPKTGTGNQVLRSIQDWRDNQFNNVEETELLFPDTPEGDVLFWGTVFLPSIKIKLLEYPWPALAAKKVISESTAAADTNKELRSAFSATQGNAP